MISDRVLAAAVAIALVAGLGLAASTLGSSVTTTPDDAIDISASRVPLGAGELQEYDQRLHSRGQKTGEGGSERRKGSADGSRGDPKSDDRVGDGSQQDQAPAEARGREQGPGPGPEEPSLLDRLLELLRALLGAFLSLLPFLVAVAVLAAAVANRGRIASLVAGRGGEDPPPETGGGPSTRPAPENDVERAWYEMATLAGIEQLETTTPRECADTAKAAGADPTAVERLTRAFEEVRYGGAAVTEERRSRAKDHLRRVRTQLGGGA